MFHRHDSNLEAMAADLVKRLGGTWKPGGALCLCPAHADRRPSLSIRVGDRALLFKCFAGCSSRDVIRELLRLDDNALLTSTLDRAGAGRSGPTDFQLRKSALRLWDSSQSLAGTIGEFYLRRRSLTRLPNALRFNARTPLGAGDSVVFRPAIITAVHEAGRFMAVQRTFFDGDEPRRARDLEEPRLMLGRPRGGAAVLAPVDDCLGLAEGTETALSAMALFGLPVWATLGAERFDQIVIPPRIDRLILFPDNDPAGEIAAAKAELAYARQGRTIDIQWPPHGYKDWNDVLRKGGKGVGGKWRQVA